MTATCATCPFYDATVRMYHGDPLAPDVDIGGCRREPGQLIQSGPDEWCGEHPLRQRDRLAASFIPALIMRASELLEQGYTPTRGEVPARVVAMAYEQADAFLMRSEEQLSCPPTPTSTP